MEVFHDPEPGPPSGFRLGLVKYAQIRALVRCKIPKTEIAWRFGCSLTTVRKAWTTENDETQRRDEALLGKRFKELRDILVHRSHSSHNNPLGGEEEDEEEDVDEDTEEGEEGVEPRREVDELDEMDEMDDMDEMDGKSNDANAVRSEASPAGTQTDNPMNEIQETAQGPSSRLDTDTTPLEREHSVISISSTEDNLPAGRGQENTWTFQSPSSHEPTTSLSMEPQKIKDFLASINPLLASFSPDFLEVGIGTQDDFKEFVNASERGRETILSKVKLESEKRGLLNPAFRPMTWLQYVQIRDALDTFGKRSKIVRGLHEEPRHVN